MEGLDVIFIIHLHIMDQTETGTVEGQINSRIVVCGKRKENRGESFREWKDET